MQQVVTFGESLLRLSPPGHQRFVQARSLDVVYGGGEANVAVAVAQLGAGWGLQAAHVTRLPAHELGQAVAMQLRASGVSTEHVVFGGEKLGIYYLENGVDNRASKVIYDRAHSAFAQWQPGSVDWGQVLAGAAWFHWSGLTPAVSETAAQACAEAIAAANRLGVPVSCDLNYRAALWKYGKRPVEVMPALVQGCDLLLAGEDVAELMLGIRAEPLQDANSPADQVAAFCHTLAQAYPRCTQVAVTLRRSHNASHNEVSAMLYAQEQLHQSAAYNLTHIEDRIGAGDAFMGALLCGLLHWPGQAQKAVDFAAAAYAYKHTLPGDALLASAQDIERLAQGQDAGRVAR
jgi:2-dehydro-3-deoxygluconokinase